MMDRKKENNKSIRIAAIIAITGNAVLAVLKITAGVWSNSGALIGDGIDSSADVLISIITLVIVGIISKPADTEHPWGHGRAETVATAFLSFVIFMAGAQLIINSIANLIAGGQHTTPSAIAVIATLISIAGKILLAWSQNLLGKRANSAMIKANAKNMASDVLISLGVLAGLVISVLTGSAYADTIIAILIGLWILKTAIDIFLETNHELMDGNRSMEPYRVIVESVKSVEGAANPHRARARRVAGFWDIDLDIDVDPNLTVLEAHRIASQVEDKIKQSLENVYDIMIHIEPSGDDAMEAFGLSENEICRNDEVVKVGMRIEKHKPKVAFICVHNSCRSQIAEALGKHLAGDVFESYSAGTETKDSINPDAVRLMKDAYGIDMELTQRPKRLDEIPAVDIVITMGCHVNCPYLPCQYREDWGLDNPTAQGDAKFLAVIESIERKIQELIAQIQKDATNI